MTAADRQGDRRGRCALVATGGPLRRRWRRVGRGRGPWRPGATRRERARPRRGAWTAAVTKMATIRTSDEPPARRLHEPPGIPESGGSALCRPRSYADLRARPPASIRPSATAAFLGMRSARGEAGVDAGLRRPPSPGGAVRTSEPTTDADCVPGAVFRQRQFRESERRCERKVTGALCSDDPRPGGDFLPASRSAAAQQGRSRTDLTRSSSLGWA